MEEEFIYIKVACYLAASAPYWQNAADYESDECGFEVVLKLTEEEHEELGPALGLKCPRCRGHMEEDSHYEVLETPTALELDEAITLADFEELDEGEDREDRALRSTRLG